MALVSLRVRVAKTGQIKTMQVRTTALLLLAAGWGLRVGPAPLIGDAGAASSTAT